MEGTKMQKEKVGLIPGWHSVFVLLCGGDNCLQLNANFYDIYHAHD